MKYPDSSSHESPLRSLRREASRRDEWRISQRIAKLGGLAAGAGIVFQEAQVGDGSPAQYATGLAVAAGGFMVNKLRERRDSSPAKLEMRAEKMLAALPQLALDPNQTLQEQLLVAKMRIDAAMKHDFYSSQAGRMLGNIYGEVAPDVFEDAMRDIGNSLRIPRYPHSGMYNPDDLTPEPVNVSPTVSAALKLSHISSENVALDDLLTGRGNLQAHPNGRARLTALKGVRSRLLDVVLPLETSDGYDGWEEYTAELSEDRNVVDYIRDEQGAFDNYARQAVSVQIS